jgi:hypothetical protein
MSNRKVIDIRERRVKSKIENVKSKVESKQPQKTLKNASFIFLLSGLPTYIYHLPTSSLSRFNDPAIIILFT